MSAVATDNAKIFSQLMSKSSNLTKISERRLQTLLVWEVIDWKLGFSTFITGPKGGGAWHRGSPACAYALRRPVFHWQCRWRAKNKKIFTPSDFLFSTEKYRWRANKKKLVSRSGLSSKRCNAPLLRSQCATYGACATGWPPLVYLKAYLLASIRN